MNIGLYHSALHMYFESSHHSPYIECLLCDEFLSAFLLHNGMCVCMHGFIRCPAEKQVYKDKAAFQIAVFPRDDKRSR